MLNEELTEKLKYLADSSTVKDEEYLSVLSAAKATVVANATGNTKGTFYMKSIMLVCLKIFEVHMSLECHKKYMFTTHLLSF
jgi:hypothetical protein